MKVLLTGGTGLIGKELGKVLVEKGHEIVVLTRSPERSKLNTPYPHVAVKWDGEAEELPLEVYEGVDAIIHLAGLGVGDKRWSAKFKDRLRTSRINSTHNLLKNAPKNLKVFIGASAIGYYPESEKPLKENEPVGNHFFGKLCKDWEMSAYESLDSKQTRIAHLRIGVVLSPQGGALEKMLPVLKTGFGGVLGSGKQIMSWVDVEDLVSLFNFVLENENAKGALNAVAPNPVTNKVLTKEIGKILSVPTVLPVPSLALKLAVGEFAKFLLMSQNVSSEKARELGFKFKYGELLKSLEKNCKV